MLGAAGMREFRASVGVIGWRLHVRFYALRRPPAGRVLLRIAELHATASRARFRAMTITSARRNGP